MALAYAGVPYARSTAQIIDTMGYLSAYSQIDKRVAELGGKIAQIRMTEDSAFLEGMSQNVATTFFWKNESVSLAVHRLFAALFHGDRSHRSELPQNCLDAGGTGSAISRSGSSAGAI